MSKNPDNRLYSTPHGFLVADKSVYDRSTSFVMAQNIKANLKLFSPITLTKKADDMRLLYNKTRAPDIPLPRSHGPFKDENPTYVCHICADTDVKNPYPMVFKHGNCLNALCVNCISRFCAYKSPCPYCQGELKSGCMKLLDVLSRPD
jgi:hypothetical protein